MTELVDLANACVCGHAQSIHASEGICFGDMCFCGTFKPKFPERAEAYERDTKQRFARADQEVS